MMIIIKDYNIVGSVTLTLEKPKYPVNWYAFKYHPDTQQYNAELLCAKCAATYSRQYSVVQSGKVGDRCYKCLDIINIPCNPFAHLPISCPAWFDEELNEWQGPEKHDRRCFDEAIVLVSVDTKTYHCHGMSGESYVGSAELLMIHNEILFIREQYIRPDILAAAVNQLFEQKIEELKDSFLGGLFTSGWGFLALSSDFERFTKSVENDIKHKESANVTK